MQRGGYRNRGSVSRGRGRGRGGSAQSNRLRGSFNQGVWHCDCSPPLPAERFKVKKEGKNQGRWFYTCQLGDGERCGFFLWEEQAKPREEAAVLANSRNEPKPDRAADVQEGWNAGRDLPQGKGLVSTAYPGASVREDSATLSPPTPALTSEKANDGVKRNAQDANLEDDDDYEWVMSANEQAELATAADTIAAMQTPQKAQKIGVYATPATGTKSIRTLPWLNPPETNTAKPTHDALNTPSKPSSTTLRGPDLPSFIEDPFITPRPPPSVVAPGSPSPPTRFYDALNNASESHTSLTDEALAELSSVRVPPEILARLRGILNKHELKTQGVTKGRDMTRVALRAKEAKIAELEAKIASLEAERECDRGAIRNLRRHREHPSLENGDESQL